MVPLNRCHGIGHVLPAHAGSGAGKAPAGVSGALSPVICSARKALTGVSGGRIRRNGFGSSVAT